MVLYQAMCISNMICSLSCTALVCVALAGLGCCLAMKGDCKAALVHLYPAVSVLRKSKPTSGETAEGVFQYIARVSFSFSLPESVSCFYRCSSSLAWILPDGREPARQCRSEFQGMFEISSSIP